MCNIFLRFFLVFMVFVLKYCYTVFSNRGGERGKMRFELEEIGFVYRGNVLKCTAVQTFSGNVMMELWFE